MSRRRVQVVVLYEDRQHATFVRRFLIQNGWENRQIVVVMNPHGRDGRGSGEQWVREQYAQEVRKLRSAPHVAKALIAVIDEDKQGVGRRDVQLSKALEVANSPARKPTEAILHIIPARNIETWLEYLKGNAVDEQETYSKFDKGLDCRPMVNTLKDMCDARKLREPAPPSLERACVEYRTRMAPILENR